VRTLAGSTSSGVTAAVTLPGYFVQISFATPQRWSTRGTLTWNSLTWTGYDVQVSGLIYDGAEASLNGALAIGNNDLAIGALVLSEGVAGRACSIWKFYGDSNPATGDPVKVFEGVCDSADIPENGPVRITLQQSGGTTTFCPRTYLTAAAGFSFLPTPGQIVTWNDETVRLSPEGI
jgi:hypothetical protein